MRTFYFETFYCDDSPKLGSDGTYIVKCKKYYWRTTVWKMLVRRGVSFQVVLKCNENNGQGKVVNDSQRWTKKAKEVRDKLNAQV